MSMNLQMNVRKVTTKTNHKSDSYLD